MQDVSGGKERVRAWPRKRNKTASKATQENRLKFRNAQLAAKYLSPQQQLDFRNTVEGTPLLPRDLVTSMLYQRLAAFIMPDGKVVYPKVAGRDVSETLDILTQTPGMGLIRGAQLWEPVPISAFTGLGVVLVQEMDLAAVASVDLEAFAGLPMARLDIVAALTMSSDGSHVQALLKTAGGYHTSGYSYDSRLYSTSGATNSYQSQSAAHALVGSGTGATWGIGNGASEGCAFTASIPNATAAYGRKMVSVDGSYSATSSALVRAFGGFALNGNTASLTGVRLRASAGTMTGKVSLFAHRLA